MLVQVVQVVRVAVRHKVVVLHFLQSHPLVAVLVVDLVVMVVVAVQAAVAVVQAELLVMELLIKVLQVVQVQPMAQAAVAVLAH